MRKGDARVNGTDIKREAKWVARVDGCKGHENILKERQQRGNSQRYDSIRQQKEKKDDDQKSREKILKEYK